MGFTLWRKDLQVESIQQSLTMNYKEKNFEYVVRNSGSAIESLIIKHVLYLRCKKNAELASEALSGIAPFLEHIENAIAQANMIGFTETNFVHVKNLVYPLLALLLSDSLASAERIAKASQLPVMQEEGLEGENNNPHDEIAKMLIAVILDDREKFLHAQARYAKDKLGSRYFEVYFNYDRLMDLIIKRDDVTFAKALIDQEQLFLQRANDKKVDHSQILDGFLDNNLRVFDVWAASLGHLARLRGMKVSY